MFLFPYLKGGFISWKKQSNSGGPQDEVEVLTTLGFLRTCIVPVAMPSELSRRFPEFLPTWRHRSVSIEVVEVDNLHFFVGGEFWGLVNILGMCFFFTPL